MGFTEALALRLSLEHGAAWWKQRGSAGIM
jgi:hypothetical protein